MEPIHASCRRRRAGFLNTSRSARMAARARPSVSVWSDSAIGVANHTRNEGRFHPTRASGEMNRYPGHPPQQGGNSVGRAGQAHDEAEVEDEDFEGHSFGTGSEPGNHGGGSEPENTGAAASPRITGAAASPRNHGGGV